MIFRQRNLSIGFAISMIFISIVAQSAVFGRGGFHGGYSGGFNHADFDHNFSNFNRGFDHPGFDRFGSDLNDMHGFDNGYHRPAEAEDRTYNWADRGLSTDNGLNRNVAANTAARLQQYTPAELTATGAAVRNAYGYAGAFDHGWWGAHPYAWGYGAWGDDWAWGASGWPAIAGWWEMPADVAPVPYDYGNNITYQNDTVYYGSQPMESTVAYYQQAQTLAQSVPVPVAEKHQLAKDWKPLGVYSLVQGGQTNTDMMFQLAVNEKGAIKGNYYNTLTNETKPVTGAVDKKSMRAAWTVGDNKNVVYDSGLSNLLKEQSPVLVHMDKDKTQQWTLVKLHQSKS